MNQVDPKKSFLGVGWAFPLYVQPSGELDKVEFEEDIRQAIMIIMGTAPGERIMRPDFGAGLNELVFEPANTTTMAMVRHRVERALTDWEARIDLEEVKVTLDPNERNKLFIDVSYRIRATNARHNLVYPFYLLEGEQE